MLRTPRHASTLTLSFLSSASNAAGEVMQAANTEARGLRAEFEAQIKAVSKKIRDMSVSSYLLGLVSPSKKDSDLGSMLSRLISPLCKEILSSASPIIEPVEEKAEESDAQEPARKKRKSNNGKAQAASSEPIEEDHEDFKVSAEVLPVMSRRVTRANAPKVASTPLPAAGNGNGKGRKGKAAGAIPFPLATPSQDPLETPHGGSIDAPSSAIANTGGRLTGFSLTTRTAVRGRRGAADGLENAICISTYDGQHFMVDGEAGLSNIPDQYKEEVAQQLEVMQKLVIAALKFK
jgi:hypothetical protein